MIQAIEYARVNKIPFLGICLGMQCAVIEFARHVCGLGGANSTELDPGTPHPVVALLTEWKDHSGAVQRRDESSDLGGTMRLGRQEVRFRPIRLRTRFTAMLWPNAIVTAMKSTTPTSRSSKKKAWSSAPRPRSNTCPR